MKIKKKEDEAKKRVNETTIRLDPLNFNEHH